jgi:hypothetical protein
LAVQPADVGLKRSAGVPATAESGVRKIIILSHHRKAKAEPDGIFRQKPLEDCVTKEHL